MTLRLNLIQLFDSLNISNSISDNKLEFYSDFQLRHVLLISSSKSKSGAKEINPINDDIKS